jgi:hypothetical protein
MIGKPSPTIAWWAPGSIRAEIYSSVLHAKSSPPFRAAFPITETMRRNRPVVLSITHKS